MCGITGFVDFQHQSSEVILQRMVLSLRHRGPDDQGVEIFDTGAALVGLGHVRLSVLDLSEAGHQPMNYRHYSITYNGEIYNFTAIRENLKERGHCFNTQTDTEVILHAFEEWGPDCVDHFIGMFSFILYDRQAQKLYGFRDRAGVKPFYYFQSNGLLLFSSELKSFHQHPGFSATINRAALGAYFHLGYIPAPQSIFEHTYKMMPGHYFEYDLHTQNIRHHRYWNPAIYYARSKALLSFKEAKAELHELLLSAVQYRMVADVPVGLFLSGGYDSTVVAALLQQGRTQKLKTFTIGFDYGNNEAPAARQLADYLGTDHHEWICTAKEAQEIIPELPQYFDEPFADSSAIPTILVSRFARQQVTVALSADGGDELFAGYTRYAHWLSYLRQLENLPQVAKRPARVLAEALSRLLPLNLAHRRHHFQTVATALRTGGANRQIGAELYKQMNQMPSSFMQRLLYGEMELSLGAFESDFTLTDSSEHPLLVDYLTYLPDDILVKVDRATMSVALEGREPLLDHRLLEWAAQLQFNYKLGANGTGKQILRSIVHDYVPQALMDRPKTGFSIPFTHWFKGDLNGLLMDVLSPDRVGRSGLINVDFVDWNLRQFNQGKMHYTPFIWKLLMFQLWWDKWMGNKTNL